MPVIPEKDMQAKLKRSAALKRPRLATVRVAVSRRALLMMAGSSLTVGLLFLPAGQLARAQAATAGQTAAPAANRFLGTITSVSSGLLIVKTDAGAEHKVTVPDGIRLQRIAPGEKDLSHAVTIQFSDLAVGDRVLVRVAPDPATDPLTAISIVAIPQADLAQKQQKDREDWQRNGVGGLVKSVDAGTGIVVITSGAGPTQKTITLHTTPATILRRYAPDSVSFDQAKPASIETIQAGDQLRARGAKNADGTELAADEVVSGSFRNISGTIASINASAMTLTLKDLATKQNVTVHVGPDAQMRKLPDTMAKMLAAMTNAATNSASGNSGAAGGASSGAGGGTPGGAGSASSAPNSPPRNANGGQATEGRPPFNQAGGSQQGGRRGGDLQQMLNRAPVIHLADLQKGDAIMLVSTQGSSDVTAVTLLAGVEPLLQAPASTQNMLLSNWNMSSGGAEAAQ
jgi:Domain of unknown function (DUF5666)